MSIRKSYTNVSGRGSGDSLSSASNPLVSQSFRSQLSCTSARAFLFVQFHVECVQTRFDTPMSTQVRTMPNQVATVAMLGQIRANPPTSQPQPKTHPNQNHETPPGQDLPIDLASIEGKFGWTQFNDKFVLYILRNGKEYAPLQIMQHQVFNIYGDYFTDEVYNCFEVVIERMTQAEVQLIKEINSTHSDNYFHYLDVTEDDRLISLKDATQIYNFLWFCYEKLVRKNNSPKYCGFIRINMQNLIPYVYYNYRQYVPLFYIDGECKYLEERAVQLTGWELCYLKLCCKVHGIRTSLFDGPSMAVVDLELVKRFYPQGTLFVDSWPAEAKAENLFKHVNKENREKIPSIRFKVLQQPNSLNQTVSIVKKDHAGDRNNNVSLQANLENRLGQVPDANCQDLAPTGRRWSSKTWPYAAYNNCPSPRTLINRVTPVTHSNQGYKVIAIPDFSVPNNKSAYFVLRVPLGNEVFANHLCPPFDDEH
ncbi:hypothetical protein NQ317_011643 [Molorchus minor]|uniref:Uncharacterized protein n=1 Tax=Molorchus minor TaxID=1323400 RepID=A0ABQ9JAT8_9CUCU|nr:hypothetical protein NQ317_011643 [Molorchus minor]